jgi:hypothetical protein
VAESLRDAVAVTRLRRRIRKYEAGEHEPELIVEVRGSIRRSGAAGTFARSAQST